MSEEHEVRIAMESPRAGDVVALLARHLARMHEVSPRDGVHALDVDSLCAPDITFWTARHGRSLVGCGALKELDSAHGEIKSMHTEAAWRGRGIGRRIALAILDEARSRGCTRVSLETGSTEHFAPARRLYASLGFEACGPFGGYAEHPHSAFMTLTPLAPVQDRD